MFPREVETSASAWTDTTVRLEYPWVAVPEEPKYLSAAAIRIIRNLSPPDNSGCCKIAFPGTAVPRTRTARGPWMPTIGWVLCASQVLEFSSLPGARLIVMRMPGRRAPEGAEIPSMGRDGRATVAELPWACWPGSGRLRLGILA